MSEGTPNLFELLISLGALWLLFRRFFKKKPTTTSVPAPQPEEKKNDWKADFFGIENDEEDDAFDEPIPGENRPMPQPVQITIRGDGNEQTKTIRLLHQAMNSEKVRSHTVPAASLPVVEPEPVPEAFQPIELDNKQTEPDGYFLSPEDLRQAVILKEILDQPKGLQDIF